MVSKRPFLMRELLIKTETFLFSCNIIVSFTQILSKQTKKSCEFLQQPIYKAEKNANWPNHLIIGKKF